MPKFLTQKELESALYEVVDELEAEHSGDVVEIDAVYIPPEPNSLTDEENIEVDVIAVNEKNSQNDVDIAGTFELQIRQDNEFDWDSSDDESLAEKKRKMERSNTSQFQSREPK
ncbi:uncharacterized protein LOC126743635 [Anthonomus grandis grandis]|uniref:uncharacterized protein LOC126743635 n=1 Tax=Anthonomus grandis grandis TaxID=2921223 RepID=UPI0021665F96|nr:uncharacterized protein LOC126743635 [Anthonomus grandis grandis]